jgi:rRNA maturation endonuclease Nob1
MEDGSGLVNLIPSLDKSKLTLSNPEKLVCLIRKGLPLNVKTGQKMPSNTVLNDVEMTNLINFLGFKYTSFTQTVQVQEVKKWMANCQMD